MLGVDVKQIARGLEMMGDAGVPYEALDRIVNELYREFNDLDDDDYDFFVAVVEEVLRDFR